MRRRNNAITTLFWLNIKKTATAGTGATTTRAKAKKAVAIKTATISSSTCRFSKRN